MIAVSLRQAGIQTHVHDDHFLPDAKDEHWLREVGRKKWIVLTKDKRIRHRTIERQALIGAGVRAFVLTAGNLHGQEMANIFVKALPSITRLAARKSSPFIATITRGGRVTILFHGRKRRGKK